MKSFNIGDVCAAVKGSLSMCGLEETVIKSVTTDSRKITEGSLFIPLKGEKFDGHDFINQAFEKGAVCCLSEKNVDCSGVVTVSYTHLDVYKRQCVKTWLLLLNTELVKKPKLKAIHTEAKQVRHSRHQEVKENIQFHL